MIPCTHTSHPVGLLPSIRSTDLQIKQRSLDLAATRAEAAGLTNVQTWCADITESNPNPNPNPDPSPNPNP